MYARIERLAEQVNVAPGVLIVLATIFVALVVGTAARLSHLHALPPKTAASLRLRLRTWWVIALALGLVILLGKIATLILMGLVSLVALREYFGIVGQRVRLGRWVVWAYTATVLQYLWIGLGWYDMFLLFIPVVAFLFLTLRVVLTRDPKGFLRSVGAVQWGMMLLVFCLSHAAFLLVLREPDGSRGGAIGWFLYLILLTEFNDIAQALFGRPFGKHKVIPEISPGKSVEGLVGAVVCTTILAVLIAPLLTAFGEIPPRFGGGDAASGFFYFSRWALLAGVMIGIGGFFGDITISAVKRDAQIKDSGTMLPGQGGILDRIDSLTFTAPIFFHYIHWLYY